MTDWKITDLIPPPHQVSRRRRWVNLAVLVFCFPFVLVLNALTSLAES